MDKHDNYYFRRCAIEMAIRDMKNIRDHLVAVGMSDTPLVAKVRSALKSADGARRPADGMVQRTITQRN